MAKKPYCIREIAWDCVSFFTLIPEEVKRQIVCFSSCQAFSCDPCTGMVGSTCQDVPQVQNEVRTVFRWVMQQCLETCKVPVCVYRPETRTVTVRIPTVREEVRSEWAPVTTCREETQTYNVRVPERVAEERVESYTVPVRTCRPPMPTASSLRRCCRRLRRRNHP